MGLPLYERVRPRRLEDVVGQDKAVAQVRRIIAGGVDGKAVWFSGPSGMGKTTLARILAAAMPPGTRVHEFGSAEAFTAGEVADIERAYYLNHRGLFPTPTAIIVNEAHRERRSTISSGRDNHPAPTP